MADSAALRDRRAPAVPAPPRRIGPPRRASRWYSRFVTVMKVALPLAALAVVAVIFMWPQFYPAINRLRQSLAAIGVEELAQSRMVNPRFRGVDDQGQPFALAADIATPSPRNPEVTELERPRGELTRNDGSWVTLTADQGTYDRTARLLDLGGRVTLFHDQGYEIQTTKAHFNFETSIAEGDEAVAGQGPDTEFESEGFRIEDRGARVFLTGQSRLVIYRQPADNALGLPDIPTAVPPMAPPATPTIAPPRASSAPAALVPAAPAPADRRRELR